MSLFRRRERRNAGSFAAAFGQDKPYGTGVVPRPSLELFSSRGVDEDTALSHDVVWRCRQLITGTVSMMAVEQDRMAGGVRTPMALSPLFTRPSDDSLYLSVWIEQLVGSLLMDGNAFGWVTDTDGRGFPTAIEPLDPTQVKCRRGQSGGWVWTVGMEPVDRYPVGRLFHIPAFTVAGNPRGLSPIAYHRDTIATGEQAEQFGLDFFRSDAHPVAVLESDQAITKDDAEQIKSRLRTAIMGRDFAVIGSGAKWRPIQVTPGDSQFLETQRYTGEQICRVFGVPPELVGIASSGSSVTYANREQRTQDFLLFGVGWLKRRLEEAFTSLVPSPQFIRLNPAALLEPDTKTLMDVATLGLRGSVYTRSEARRMFGLPPLPGPDQDNWPPFTTGKVAETPAQDNGTTGGAADG